MTKAEVCEMLHCSERTLDRWRSMRRAKRVDIGEVKIRRKVQFRREKIQRLVDTPKLWLAGT